MAHDTTLIATIVVGLVLAFAFGFLATRLHLPPLVGYLLAGVAVGPFTPGFVADTGLAGQLAEIGVILLMFGVGLHFSIGDLLAVYPIAVPGALAQMVVAVTVGMGLAVWWGWGAFAGLLLGLALSVASTVVLLRVLEERGALDSPEGRIAIGWLIVQDVVMVLALVLLPALAGGAPDSAAETSIDMAGVLALTLGKVLLFVVLVLAVGRRVIPWVLVRAARTGSRELFTLAVLAAALGIAYGSAELFGVSFALGAFFAGVVLSETDLSHQAAANSLPLRDAFAVLFFVSVGMLFDPTILLREPLRVMAILVVILVLKSLPAFVILLAFGQPVGAALRVSAGLAQIGEFSFILAAFGVASGLLPPEGRDLILAGALLSITINPLAFGTAERVYRQLKRWPALVAWLGRSKGMPPDKYARSKAPKWRDHAVLVGFGRVGSTVGQVLEQLDLPFVVIEQDHRLAEELRRRGLAVVWGDAGAPGVLAAARVRWARLLVVTTPDRLQTRRILEQARDANPGIDTIVRVHSQGELAYLERQGVGLAVMGERELALGMVDYALRSLGLREAEARLMVRAFRTSGDARTFEQDDEGGQRTAPELRQHADRADEATPG